MTTRALSFLAFMAVLPLATSFAPLAVPSKAPAQRSCPMPALRMGVVGDILGVTTKLMPAANKVEIAGGAPFTSTGANAETMKHWEKYRPAKGAKGKATVAEFRQEREAARLAAAAGAGSWVGWLR